MGGIKVKLWWGMGKAFTLRNGLVLLSTEAPGGVYNAAQLQKIAELCSGDAAVAKATEDQRLAVFVAPQHAAKVAAELKAVGLGARHYQDGLHQPVNCLGELCSEYQQDALGTSMDLTSELATLKLASPLKIGINGCARCCVAVHTLDIAVIGDSMGYRVSLGGKNSQIPEMASFMAEGIPAAKLPKLIAKVVAVYKELAEPQESLQELMERKGSRAFIEALAPYSQDAHQDDPFSAPSKTAPAAGSADTDDEASKIDDLPDETAFSAEPGIEDGLDAEGLTADPAIDDVQLDDAEQDLSIDALPATDDDSDLAMATSDDELVIDEDVLTTADAPLDMGDGTADEIRGDDLSASSDPAPDAGLLASAEAEDIEITSADLGDEILVDELAISDDISLDDTPVDATGDDAEFQVDAARLDAPMSADALEDETFGDDVVLAEPLLIDETELSDEPAAPATAAAGQAAPAAAAPHVAASAPASQPQGDSDDINLADEEMTAPEVTDAEADAFEQKLNDSIAEEESMPEVVDDNAADRMHAMQLVEAAAEGEHDATDSGVTDDAHDLVLDDEQNDDELMADASADTDTDTDTVEQTTDQPAGSAMNDLDISEETLADASFDTISLPATASTTAFAGDDEVFAEEAISPDPSNLPEPAALPVAKAQPTKMPTSKAPESKSPESRALSPSKPKAASPFDFTGIDMGPDGRISLLFASGAAMELDPHSLASAGRRELNIAGKKIAVVPRPGGVNIEIDGVALFLPQKSAA